MSFDIWIECYRNGKIASIPLEAFEAIFLPYCSNRDEYAEGRKFMQVKYDDGGRSDIYIGRMSDEALAELEAAGPLMHEKMIELLTSPQPDDDEPIRHITFNYCGGDAFFAGLYELADRTRSIISWAAFRPIYVFTREGIGNAVPKGSFYDGIRSRIVRNGADIVDAIQAG